jgi:hypothetical protein
MAIDEGKHLVGLLVGTWMRVAFYFSTIFVTQLLYHGIGSVSFFFF